MAKVPNGVETLPTISIGWVGHKNVSDRQTTDRQTHRQTDLRRYIANVHVREFTFAKKPADCVGEYRVGNRYKADTRVIWGNFVRQITAVAGALCYKAYHQTRMLAHSSH